MTVCIIHNADLQKLEEIAVGNLYSTFSFVVLENFVLKFIQRKVHSDVLGGTLKLNANF